MRIGLVDSDCHVTKKKWGQTIYPNLALCKLSRYHKEQGDDVEWALPFEHYDVIYRSKIFNYSLEDTSSYHADKVVYGGTGYDITSKLPDYIDRLQPDYSIYPHIPSDTAYGFLTRGCPNKCPWCVVPRKEGYIHPYMDCEEIAIEGRNKLVLMDNNILAAGDYAKEQLSKIIERGYYIDFNQAMDARLVTDDFARLLGKIKWIQYIRLGCDTTAQVKECERAMDMITGYGFKGRYFLYCMLNDDFKESYSRIQYWEEMELERRETNHGKHVFAYAQPYRDPDNPNRPIPQWQKDMAAWCNNKARFFACTFDEFEPRKGFSCSEYFRMYNYEHNK